MKSLRILHFVTGGFSGATKVAVDLVAAHNKIAQVDNLLVMRRKKTTTSEKLAELDDKHINYELVTGSTHIATVQALKKICQKWQPDILVAHGFPEHLLGRQAGLLAKVPILVQVEHNSQERYTPWKLYQTRRLSKHTTKIVGVSKGVAQVLTEQHLKAPIQAIPNGIDTDRFGGINPISILDRPKDLIMVGRYAKSKDHVTLIEALHQLKKMGVTPSLTLVGSGRKQYQQEVHALVERYDLQKQVTFIEYSSEIDKLLSQHKVFVMSSRFEGLNLAVLEAMASACVVIGSRAVGVEELIDDQKDGFLFPIGDANALADIIKTTLSELDVYQPLALAAREKVLAHYDQQRVTQAYYQLFQDLMASR